MKQSDKKKCLRFVSPKHLLQTLGLNEILQHQVVGKALLVKQHRPGEPDAPQVARDPEPRQTLATQRGGGQRVVGQSADSGRDEEQARRQDLGDARCHPLRVARGNVGGLVELGSTRARRTAGRNLKQDREKRENKTSELGSTHKKETRTLSTGGMYLTLTKICILYINTIKFNIVSILQFKICFY